MADGDDFDQEFAELQRQGLFKTEAKPDYDKELSLLRERGLLGGSEKEPPQERSWSDVPLEALGNAPGSAVKFAQDIVHPIMHPIQTYENIRDLGKGALQKAGVMGGDDKKANVDAVVQFFIDRYGGEENFKKTIAEDPVGFLSDVSMIFTGGGMAAAKAPSIVSKGLKAVGHYTDPLTPAFWGAQKAGQVGAGALGWTTGVGTEAVKTAAQSGFKGGPEAEAFQKNLRGLEPPEKTVESAKVGFENMRREAQGEYNRRMALEVKPEKTALDYTDLFDRLDKLRQSFTFRGDAAEGVLKILDKADDIVLKWSLKNHPENHTPAGFDALKQKIGDELIATTQPGSKERVIANAAYKAVEGTVAKQVPIYSEIMEGYAKAMAELRAIEKELSLPKDQRTGNLDTALRKLQSTLRNNVNTNYGRRRELAQFLVDHGSPQLIERLAGQAMQPGLPRGMQRLAITLGGEMLAIMMGTTGAVSLPHGIALAALGLPTASPRAVGEAAYYAGRAASPLKALSKLPKGVRYGMRQGLYQSGRLPEALGDLSAEEEDPLDFLKRAAGQ